MHITAMSGLGEIAPPRFWTRNISAMWRPQKVHDLEWVSVVCQQAFRGIFSHGVAFSRSDTIPPEDLCLPQDFYSLRTAQDGV